MTTDAKTVPPGTTGAKEPSKYELLIDSQVEKFLETKQKLTYFLVTASVASIAFTVNFVQDKLDAIGWTWYVLAAGVIAGLLSAGSALRALNLDLNSYRLHIKYRYSRKGWDDLTEQEQGSWDRLTRHAAWFLNASFVLLFVEIVLIVAFFAIFFLIRSNGAEPPYWPYQH